MEIVIALIVAAVLLLVWRIFVILRERRTSRPIDSGHPHLTDVDPHSPD